VLLPLKAQGKGALSDALRNLQDLCCASVAGKFEGDRSGLLMHTPATLARLVMGLASRVQLRLGDNTAAAAAAGCVGTSSSSSSVMQLLQQLPEHWPLQPPFQVAWRAAWQWLLHATSETPTESSSSSSSSTADHTASQQQQQQATQVVGYSGSMRPSGFDTTPTPVLRLILLSRDALARLTEGDGKVQLLNQLMGNTAAAAAATAIRVFSIVDDALKGQKSDVDLESGIAVVDSVAVALEAQEPDTRPMQVRKSC
jgi:hypothetical protein